MEWRIPLFKSYAQEDDVEAVAKVIREQMYWANGPSVQEFEKKIAAYTGRKYALTFNSGTSALHSTMLSYAVKGGEVIVPSFTFISTANSVVLAGGKPVFAEIEGDSYGLDVVDVVERINKKTRAIMPIHYGGAPCKDIQALEDIAKDHKIYLIEDAAESLGSSLKGKKVGTFGDCAMFSFCQNKIASTGEGGVIVTDDIDLIEKLKLIRSHGRVESPGSDYFSSSEDMDYIDIGYNYRMPTMLAALGISQLNKISKVIRMRQSIAGYLSNGLSHIKDIKLPIFPPEVYHVYQMYTIQLKNKKQRDALQNHMTEKGIMTKVYFNPVHLKTYYRKNYGYNVGDLPITEEISEKVLTLPIYPNLSAEEMDCIIGSVNSFFSKD
jgi:perosamine synthetase